VYGTETKVNDELASRVVEERIGKLCIHRNGQPNKLRKYNIIAGFGRDHNLGVYNNGVDTIARALTERYFFCLQDDGSYRRALPVADGAFRNMHFKRFEEELKKHLPRLPRLSRQQVVDRYTGTKKRLYTDAMISLAREPLNKFDAALHMFPKMEKQNLDKAPRGINPRTPRYNLELGRFLKHAEKPIYQAINKVFESVADHTVIKGLNAEDSARQLKMKWDRFEDPVAVGADAVKYDMHYSVEALRDEHQTYHNLFPGNKKLEEMLSWQLVNYGVAYAEDGKVEFKIDGTRCSGEITTSTGNSKSMCKYMWCYARQKGVVVEVANNGDDTVIFMEKRDLARFMRGFEAWFADRGFAMTLEEPVYEFEQVEFCQTRPVCVDGTWRMIRNQNAVLQKDPICLIAIQNDKVYRKWLDAVGTCGMALNAGVPVQQSFHQCFKRHGLPCSKGMMDHIHRNSSAQARIQGMKTGRTEIAPSTRVSYYYAFGVTPDEQVAIEDAYDHAQIGKWEGEPMLRGHLDNTPGIRLLHDEIPW